MQLLDFVRSFASWCKFLGRLSCDQGVPEGGSLLDRHRRDGEAMGSDSGLGVRDQSGCSRWHRVEDYPCRFASELGDIRCRADGSEIEDAGTAGYQDQIAESCRSQRWRLDGRGSVDDGKVRTVIRRSSESAS